MILNDISPCGLDCVNCEMHVDNNRTDVWEIMAKALGKTVEEMKCKGCREQNGCTVHDACATLECVQKKGLNFCSDCDEFPCTMLQPARDMADRLPHNFKVYNLCRIKRVGAEAFLKEAPGIRERYFKGKMTVGLGPVLD
ncbi:MAG: DUF3795 domain-containing protein [Spirochaetaceae bacterium]|jgi:hypothetical protein|nr:DUF3795 domain-containing protein [Spirochaetaceae bacterium]